MGYLSAAPYDPFAPGAQLELLPPAPPPRTGSWKTNTRIEHVAKVAVRNMHTHRDKKKLKVPVEIDAPYVFALLRKQGMRCAISGIPFDPARSAEFDRNPWGPSVDRIDNDRGYVDGNVRVVLSIVNYGMNRWGADHYRAVCHAVARRDLMTMESGLMTMGGWRFSTKPVEVWRMPDMSTVPDDTLLTLEDAVWLPELGGHFTDRDLWRVCNSGRLRSTRPTGKLYFVTRAWVREWIESPLCRALESPPASRSSKGNGASGTAASNSALASARARTARLKLV